MAEQLSFSTYEVQKPVRPYAVGDILQTKPFGRVVVQLVDENINGQVFVCVSLVDGRTCVVLPREIEWRSS